ncbi:hypothetical protein CVT26_012421 [Gymnopilus dilepis]|uniref:Uncharacterized protein n=1 Tax=Gymnopilus dilepis TaxID=231916 RepID=A0A409YWD8_9AGAR|nr:hypothetical protein CVT26_012421 [Gymnopilus dilepis]
MQSNIEDIDGSKLDLDLDYDRPEHDWNGPGLEADMELEEGGCGIASSSGGISMRPLWRKVDKDGKASELFEGTFTFKATYSYLYSKRGHGKGQELSLAFWAVRAKV